MVLYCFSLLLSISKHVSFYNYAIPGKISSVVIQGKQHSIFNNSHWYLITSWALFGLKIDPFFITTFLIFRTPFLPEKIFVFFVIWGIMPLFGGMGSSPGSMCPESSHVLKHSEELVSHGGSFNVD